VQKWRHTYIFLVSESHFRYKAYLALTPMAQICHIIAMSFYLYNRDIVWENVVCDENLKMNVFTGLDLIAVLHCFWLVFSTSFDQFVILAWHRCNGETRKQVLFFKARQFTTCSFVPNTEKSMKYLHSCF
jgi:hypothetical protein